MSEVNRYMGEVASLLECPDKEKDYYLSIIENEFAEEADRLSYGELVDRLGSPQEWANAHLDITGGEAYENKIANLKKKRKMLTLIIIAITLLIAAITIYVCIINRRSRGFKGYYGDPIIESTEMLSDTKGNPSLEN